MAKGNMKVQTGLRVDKFVFDRCFRKIQDDELIHEVERILEKANEAAEKVIGG